MNVIILEINKIIIFLIIKIFYRTVQLSPIILVICSAIALIASLTFRDYLMYSTKFKFERIEKIQVMSRFKKL